MDSLVENRYVQVDDIALFERSEVRDAVTDLLIDADAETLGEINIVQG